MDISDYVDHWEINRTFKTLNNSTLQVDTLNNNYNVVSGHNQVLIVTTEKIPVFKEGKELTDLYSTKSLLIELDSADNQVTAENPMNSRMFRLLIAFSPDYGINPLDKMDQITLTRTNSTAWTIVSKIYDFEFNGQIDFVTNQSLTDTYQDY